MNCVICKKETIKNRAAGVKGELCGSCRVARTRRKRKNDAVIYKGGSCYRCGYNKSNAALTFHHLDPKEKEFTISHKGKIRPWEELKKELDKCVLLCHNCHAEVHEEESTKKIMDEYFEVSKNKKKEIKHGTAVAYTYHKCRCNECKEYNALRNRKYKKPDRSPSGLATDS